MTPKVVIIGANGHAKVIIDIIISTGKYKIVGCTDINQIGNLMGIPILGDDSILPDLLQQGVNHAFIALGSNILRKKISKKIEELGFTLINAISPYSHISSSVKIGKGTAIMPGAIINADCTIGNNVIINTGATIDHDCIIKDYAHVGPGSNLAGNVHINEGAFMGIGAKAIPQKTIGQWAVIGAGAVVIDDIAENTIAVGIPAKTIKKYGKGE